MSVADQSHQSSIFQIGTCPRPEHLVVHNDDRMNQLQRLGVVQEWESHNKQKGIKLVIKYICYPLSKKEEPKTKYPMWFWFMIWFGLCIQGIFDSFRSNLLSFPLSKRVLQERRIEYWAPNIRYWDGMAQPKLSPPKNRTCEFPRIRLKCRRPSWFSVW